MKKLLLIAALLAPSTMFAGGCWTDTAIGQTGVGFRAVVQVLNSVPALINLFQDPGLSQGMMNPFKAQQNGRFQFCAPRGHYTVQVSGPGVTFYQYDVYVTDGTSTVPMTFKMCSGSPCVLNDASDPQFLVSTGTVNKCWAFVNTLPVGANLIIDVLIDSTSILPSGNANKFNFVPAGAQVLNKTLSPPTPITSGTHVMSLKVLQVGSGTAGQDVTVSCQVSLN